MNERLFIEALSVPSPETSEQMVNIVDRSFITLADRTLIVLPEYFIDGDNLYDGRHMSDPMVTNLVNYASDKRVHIVSGMVELDESDNKHITGLLIGPSGIIGSRRKATPTPFEVAYGAIPGDKEIKTFDLENNLGTLAIAMCFEVFELDREVREVNSDILVNPRGFDLDDPNFGELSRKWLIHNQDLAMMGKRYVVGATGSMGQPGPLAEIIDFEGDVLEQTFILGKVISTAADLNLLHSYLDGSYQSHTVPVFHRQE